MGCLRSLRRRLTDGGPHMNRAAQVGRCSSSSVSGVALMRIGQVRALHVGPQLRLGSRKVRDPFQRLQEFIEVDVGPQRHAEIGIHAIIPRKNGRAWLNSSLS